MPGQHLIWHFRTGFIAYQKKFPRLASHSERTFRYLGLWLCIHIDSWQQILTIFLEWTWTWLDVPNSQIIPMYQAEWLKMRGCAWSATTHTYSVPFKLWFIDKIAKNKKTPHRYTTSINHYCWHKGGWIHVQLCCWCLILTPPFVCFSRNEDSPDHAMFFLLPSSTIKLVYQCPLQPELSVLWLKMVPGVVIYCSSITLMCCSELCLSP